MANPEPNFSIDTRSVQEDEWVIYLKILTVFFTSMLSSLTSSCLEQDVFISLQDVDWFHLFNDVDTLKWVQLVYCICRMAFNV